MIVDLTEHRDGYDIGNVESPSYLVPGDLIRYRHAGVHETYNVVLYVRELLEDQAISDPTRKYKWYEVHCIDGYWFITDIVEIMMRIVNDSE